MSKKTIVLFTIAVRDEVAAWSLPVSASIARGRWDVRDLCEVLWAPLRPPGLSETSLIRSSRSRMPALRSAFAAIVRLPEAAVMASEYMGFVWRGSRGRVDERLGRYSEPGAARAEWLRMRLVAEDKDVWRLDARRSGSCGSGQSQRHRHFVRH